MGSSNSTKIRLLVGTAKGAFIFTSDADRQRWEMQGPLLGGWEVYSLYGDHRRMPRLFAGTSHAAYGPTLRISDDLGATWREIEQGPSYPAETGFKLNRIWQIAPGHPSQPETFYAGVDEAGLFVSHDRGETWQELDGLTKHPSRPEWFPGAGGMCLHTILVHPDDPQRLLIAISAVGVFRSEDGGKTWQTSNNGLLEAHTGQPASEIGSCVHKVVMDRSDPNVLFMQEHLGVFRSNDGGASWFTIEEGLPAAHLHHPEWYPFGFPIVQTRAGNVFLIPLESSEQRNAASGDLRVYRRSRDGAAWEPTAAILPAEPRYESVLRDAMTVDDQEQTGIYFGTTGGDLFYSLDEGDSWQRLPGRFPRILHLKTWTLDA